MIEPSYSSPDKKSDFQDNGEKDFHKIVSHILIAMNKEIAELPTPYPLVNNSSNNITTIPANVNCITIMIAFPAPS